jgi:hypothetical protein
MTRYEHALLRAWYTGQITDNEFALAWQLEQARRCS